MSLFESDSSKKRGPVSYSLTVGAQQFKLIFLYGYLLLKLLLFFEICVTLYMGDYIFLHCFEYG
jgi:hypothetical protein